jgi:hypothetical protein
MARNAIGMMTPIAIFALVERPVHGVRVVSEERCGASLRLMQQGDFGELKGKLRYHFDVVTVVEEDLLDAG